MKCAEANKVDLVDYLCSFGFIPAKTISYDCWYLSPFRNEKEASFKVNKTKNVWYGHGAGKGGSVVDFVTSYFNCNVLSALQKLSYYQQTLQKQFISTEMPISVIFPKVSEPELFDQQLTPDQQIKQGINTTTQHEERPPFHLYNNSLINHKDATETAIEIIAAKKPITKPMLCRYLREKRIDKSLSLSHLAVLSDLPL